MSPKAKKYLITTRTHEIFIMRYERQPTIYGFCPECQKEVVLLTSDSAVTHSGKRARELFGLIESGVIHAIETASGHLLICRDSLLAK